MKADSRISIKHYRLCRKLPSVPRQSGAEATALQTLRAVSKRLVNAQRLDCGGSPPLFLRAPVVSA